MFLSQVKFCCRRDRKLFLSEFHFFISFSWSCGQLCKNFRGLKLHHIKAKCQASENKLSGPDKRCFVSLTDILNISFLKFGDTIYCKTPLNTFVPICNFDKPISCFEDFRVTWLQSLKQFSQGQLGWCCRVQIRLQWTTLREIFGLYFIPL